MNNLLCRFIRRVLIKDTALTVSAILLPVLILSGSLSVAFHPTTTVNEEAYFVFDLQFRPDTFIIKLTDAEKIKKARDILSGLEQNTTHIGGVIVKSQACYNPPWSFHLDPQSVTFFSGAIEVCDASIQYVEDHLTEVGGAFLPGSRWCPINSRLLKEVPKPDCSSKTVISVSAASYSRTKLASEAIAAAYGSNLSATTEIATAFPLPTSLAGTTVKVKDSSGAERLAPLFYVSPTQINYLIPAGTLPGMATITVTDTRGNVTIGTEVIMEVGPGFFTADASGRGVPAALVLRVKGGRATYELVARYDAAQQKFVPIPIDLGPEAGQATEQVFLILFGTGLRPNPSMPLRTFIGDQFVEPLYIGAQPAYIGLDQVNLPIPRNLSGRGEVDVKMEVDDKLANPVRISIK